MIVGGHEADRDGFVPAFPLLLSARRGGPCGTAAVQGGRRRPRQMSTAPEEDDDRGAADGVWEV